MTGQREDAPRYEWHDASEEATRGRPLWVYLDDGSGDFAAIEMGTWGREGWVSALNPRVEFAAERVQAWAEIVYPDFPVRRWEAPSRVSDSGREDAAT